MDSSNDSDFVKAFKSGPKSPEHGEESPINNQAGNSNPPLSECGPNSFGIMSPAEETHD